jgi:O-antigen/teichoic acid export membrane protein
MLRNVVHLGLGQIATTVLTILLSAAIARTLGAADFGLLYLLTSVATFAYVFVDWGHGLYIPREVARRPERTGDLLGSVLVVRAAMALLMCVPTVAITWLLGYDLRTRALAMVTILAWLPVYLGLSYAWVFRGRERMDCDATINVVLKFSGLIASLACLALGGRVLGLVLVSLVSGSITFVVANVLYRRLRLPPLTVTLATARELLRDGAAMLAFLLAIAAQPYIDANMLYKFAPRGVVGWYAAAWNIAGTLVAPAAILAATMYPRLSKEAADKEGFKRALRLAFRPLLLVALLGAVGAFLYADVAIGIIYSKRQFAPAAAILRAFAPALLLLYVDMMFGQAIMAMGRAGLLAWVKLASVLVTTALEFALIPWSQARYANGGIGLMLALAGGELLMVVAALVILRDAINKGMLVDLLRGLLVGIGTIVLMRFLPVVPWLIGIPVCVGAFVVFCVLAGLLNRADLRLLAATITKRNPARSGVATEAG